MLWRKFCEVQQAEVYEAIIQLIQLILTDYYNSQRTKCSLFIIFSNHFPFQSFGVRLHGYVVLIGVDGRWGLSVANYGSRAVGECEPLCVPGEDAG